ncbi:MAG: phosphotransferase [Nostoc sp.]|uniref:phosphotransferase enzyme family protein n=1 Tax=Nostoc sp. TaxID=1180 RepID=UPI002FF8FEF2
MYLVTTERENYILRVYRRGWRNQEEIDFELELLAFLHEQNQPVAYPIVRNEGTFTTEILAPEDMRYAAIFTYAPGYAVNDNLDGKQSYILGEQLAEDPFYPSLRTHKLKGDSLGIWACSIDYNNRILFEFVPHPDSRELIISLLTLSSHDDVY